MKIEVEYKGITLEIKGQHYPEDDDLDYQETFNIESINIGGGKDIQAYINEDATTDIIELILEQINK